MILPMLLASAAAFDYHLETNHPGGDMVDPQHTPPAPGQPFALPKSTSNLTDFTHWHCHDICEANKHCAGWVVLPSDCPYHQIPPGQAACWLKKRFSGKGVFGIKCRVSGFVRLSPPPPPRPPLPQPTQPTELTVDASNVTHQLRKLDMGCHSDSGYSHQPRNLYSQMM